MFLCSWLKWRIPYHCAPKGLYIDLNPILRITQ
nr:MAG TPA: hypothetical protein [Siphoviridae sp. ctEfY6]